MLRSNGEFVNCYPPNHFYTCSESDPPIFNNKGSVIKKKLYIFTIKNEKSKNINKYIWNPQFLLHKIIINMFYKDSIVTVHNRIPLLIVCL